MERKINAAAFKARCLALIDEVADSGQSLTKDLPDLGSRAKRSCDAALRASELAVSTIVFFELGQLVKRRRIAGPESVFRWRSRLLMPDADTLTNRLQSPQPCQSFGRP